MKLLPVRRLGRALAPVLLIFACSSAAQAQLRLPGGLPTLPALPTQLPGRAIDRLADAPVPSLRRQTVQALLREHADLLEADPAGEPVLRGELLLVSPSPALLAAARAEGFAVLRDEPLPGLDDLRSVVLQAPRGRSTADALAWLRAQDPALAADFNHVYTRSGDAGPSAAPPGAAGLAPTAATSAAGTGRVGLIDSGVDSRHPALRAAPVRRWGCDGAEIGSPHGTAVASLLVGQDSAFAGALPGATLHAADVYCGQAVGGSAERIAQALAWMARERVAVVNVSLVGPANRLLDQAVHALAARGHLVVAAVGNDGPAAPPLYPAACADAVGVTGVNARRRVLPEAAQGPQVAFAAPGAELAAAGPGGEGYTVVRGTSFAAPLVAGLLAARLPAPEPAAARAAVQALAHDALDLGASGRDPVFGWGLVAEARRVAPEQVHARLPR
ncbi:S8 family serine peptidase [Ideonella sp.]|uniref:S8 family serine peptidase n=1 Tax=Ideonella sp. TaxID=1929293 RepID=UPI002B46392B|nr:S8 family serine peptidase [Ideonella sp.]HJV70047.1 S8 family serine peptidase [Ideonella sp.]